MHSGFGVDRQVIVRLVGDVLDHGDFLPHALLHHPALVDYTEAPDGKSLVKGKTVAVVDFTNDKLTCSYNRQQ